MTPVEFINHQYVHTILIAYLLLVVACLSWESNQYERKKK